MTDIARYIEPAVHSDWTTLRLPLIRLGRSPTNGLLVRSYDDILEIIGVATKGRWVNSCHMSINLANARLLGDALIWLSAGELGRKALCVDD